GACRPRSPANTQTRATKAGIPILCVLVACALRASCPVDAAPPTDVPRITEGFVLGPILPGGRSPVHVDPVEHAIVTGRWTAPKAGDSVRLADGSQRAWEKVDASSDGTIDHRALRGGGYAFVTIDSSDDRILLLEARGHNMVYVNGEPRVGDPYGYGYVHL